MDSWSKLDIQDNKSNTSYSASQKAEKKKLRLKSFDILSPPLNDEGIIKINNFIERINKLYTSPKLRIDETAWKKLLSHPMVQDMEYGMIFKKEVLYYFTKHYYLPKKIWNIVDITFCFSTDYSQESDDYSYSIMLYSLINELDSLSSLSYEFISDIEPDLFDIYLSYRESVYRDLERGDFQEASVNLNAAYEICDHDPELIRLNGDYFYLNQNFENAIPFYKKALNLNKKDYYSMEKIGKSFYKLKSYEKAIPYLIDYIEKYSKQYNIILLLGMCYYRTHDFLNAKKYFDILFNNTHKYLCLDNYKKNINKQLKRKCKLIEDDFDYTLPIEENPRFKYLYPDGYVTFETESILSMSNIGILVLFIIAVFIIILFIFIFFPIHF